MATGTVKWFSGDKGDGFIISDPAGRDLSAEHTGFAGNGSKCQSGGEAATRDTEQGPNGSSAASGPLV